MICEKCGSDTMITDTAKFKHSVIRHRKCKKCGHDFFTVERETDYYDGKNRLLEKRYKKKRGRD